MEANCARVWQRKLGADPIGNVVGQENHHVPTTLLSLANLKTQFLELLLGNDRWRTAHGVHTPRCLRKGNHVADRRLTRKDHDNSIKSQRNAAMRRRTVFQCLQEEAELVPCLSFRKPQRLEDARLQVTAMNSDGSATDLRSVQHQVVSLCTNGSRVRFKDREILCDR